MRRKHHRRYQGRFTRLASLARSLTAPAAAGVLLVLAAPLVIMPMPAPAQGNAQSATYRVTFEGKFTASALASGVSVPSGEHFTTLIGAVHNGSVTFWSSGGTASAGVEAVAELGNTGTFKSEIKANMNAVTVFEQSIASGGTATATVDIVVTTDHPRVTLLSMVAPSPDWFVGVSGLSLLDAQADWLPSRTVNLYPWDAGTEEGTEFSLSNPATSPQGTITSLRGMGKFSNEPIATLTFTRQSVAPEITSATTFPVDEGTTAVATLTAEDQDSAVADLAWSNAEGAEDVAIPDDGLRRRVGLALGKAEGESITVAEMATLTSLDLSRVVVTDLTGLEHAVNLRELFLGGNAIADLSPLDGLAVAVRHTTAPGLGNLTYGEGELWQPIATLRAPRRDRNMGYARAFMAGGYLNLIRARDKIGAAIDVWDVSDPRDPVLHRTWRDDRLREAHGLGLWNRDSRIVLAAQSQEGVAFYDVTDVGERLPLLAELDLPGVGAASYGGAWWLSVQAPHVYVATIGGGLHVVDATDPTAPRQVNHLPTGALGGISPGNVYALGNLLVLAEVDEARGFATMDISDPVNPVLLETTNGAAGYSHLFTAGLLLSSGNRLNANRMYVHRVDHDGGIRYVGEAGENLGEGGYGSYQDGYFLSGFSKQVAKFTIDPPAQVGAGTSGIDLRDEDWAQPLGNLILASDDKNVGTALIPHRAAPDATGPEVVWRHPAAGATGLALTTRIGVSLSDVVAVESLTPANFRVRTPDRGVVAGQLSVNQNNVNFSPDAPLAPSTTYEVEVCNLADLVGNAGGCAGWTFTTRAEETGGGRAPTCSLARLAPVEAGVETTYVPASTAYAPTAHTWDFGAGEPVGPQVTPVAVLAAERK